MSQIDNYEQVPQKEACGAQLYGYPLIPSDISVRGGEITETFYSMIHPEPEYDQGFCRQVFLSFSLKGPDFVQNRQICSAAGTRGT